MTLLATQWLYRLNNLCGFTTAAMASPTALTFSQRLVWVHNGSYGFIAVISVSHRLCGFTTTVTVHGSCSFTMVFVALQRLVWLSTVVSGYINGSYVRIPNGSLDFTTALMASQRLLWHYSGHHSFATAFVTSQRPS